MATYDLGQGRLCLRVVYDGPEGVGKTTNVQQLSQDFSARRVMHQHRADELFGRTVSFDWEQFNTGITAGLPVQCQVLSVPGQRALRPRRQALLATADAVVFVASAEERDSAITATAFRELQDELAGREPRPPVIIQINRMDTARTGDARAVAEALGLVEIADANDRPTPVIVGATATEARGVMDTFIEAVRAAGQAVQREIDAGSGRIPLRAELPAEVESLRDRVENLALDDDDAAEMLLRELARHFDTAQEDADFGALLAPPSSATIRAAVWPPPTPPSLPSADAPAGHVWPPDAGRRLLVQLGGARKNARNEKRIPALLDGDTYRATMGERGEWLAVTGRAERFTSEDAARIALAEAARNQPRPDDDTDDALPSILALSKTDDGTLWLWTLSRDPSAPISSAKNTPPAGPGGGGGPVS